MRQEPSSLNQSIFKIQNPDVVNALNLDKTEKLLYSFNQINKGLTEENNIEQGPVEEESVEETVPNIKAQKAAPIAEPYPPVSKQPPTTAAAIASNSFKVPRIVSAEPASKT